MFMNTFLLYSEILFKLYFLSGEEITCTIGLCQIKNNCIEIMNSIHEVQTINLNFV